MSPCTCSSATCPWCLGLIRPPAKGQEDGDLAGAGGCPDPRGTSAAAVRSDDEERSGYSVVRASPAPFVRGSLGCGAERTRPCTE
jgi:hypothetical protein